MRRGKFYILLALPLLGAAFLARPWEQTRETTEFTCSSSVLPSALTVQKTLLSGARYAASIPSHKAVCHGKVLAVIPAAAGPAGLPAAAPDQIHSADSHSSLSHRSLSARAPPRA